MVNGKEYRYFTVVYYSADGRRQRDTFPTRAEAEKALRKIETKLTVDAEKRKVLAKRIGEKADKLTTDQLLDAARSMEILQGRATLVDAVKEFVERHPIGPAESVEATMQRYLDDMTAAQARPSSIADKRVKLRVFCRDYGKAPTVSIDEILIRSWCVRKAFSPPTAHAYTSAARSLVNFFHGRKRRRRQGDETMPTTWAANRVRLLLGKAEEQFPEMIPAMVLLWFAGLRPKEMLRMTWDQINLTAKTVHVTPEIAKTRTSRVVDLPDNAVAWLLQYRGTGKVVSSYMTYRRGRLDLLGAAGIKEWPRDVPRHTFATIHYKTHQDIGKTMEQLGHFGNAHTFTRHYKGQPVTREQAAEYWTIRPGCGQEEIIDIAAGAAVQVAG